MSYHNIGKPFERAVITEKIFTKMVDNIYNKITHNTPLQITKQDVEEEVHKAIKNHAFHYHRTFNYYIHDWVYYYDKDIQMLENNIYNLFTGEYYFRKLQGANKIASNPWNNEYAKNKHQKIKTHSVKNTNKLTTSRTYNKIEPCFL